MKTIHMQTDTVRSMARQMSLAATEAETELRSIELALQDLAYAWQGGSSDDFSAQAREMIHQLQGRNEALSLLASCLEREVNEWEEVDQRAAASIRANSLSNFIGHIYATPSAGGGLSNVSFYNNSILPVFTALSAVPLLSGLPAWLDSFLDRFFPQPELPSPILTGSDQGSTQPSTTFGDLLKESPAATETMQAPKAHESDVYLDLPAKSQGNLLGSAACLPTSISMVTDYFHTQDQANQTATPAQLIDMLDPGDAGAKGVTLNRMNDDVGELGYQQVSLESEGNFDSLTASLQDGPVIVNTGVKLIGGEIRDIQQPGSVNHAMVLKGINAENVMVNDPWSGTEKVFSRETFNQMWSNGGNYMLIIRP